MTESRCRQNFAAECEAAINKQINMELEASYAYMAFATYFDQDDVALENVSKFFKKMSHEDREHAEKLASYQNKRGGRVVYDNISKPSKIRFCSLQEAMETGIAMQKKVNESLIKLTKLAEQNNDPELVDFISSEFLHEQVSSIKQFADYTTQAERAGRGLGEYLFDKLTIKD